MGKDNMFGLTPQVILIRIAACLVWSLACFTTGYVYKWHRVSLEQAAHDATQTTAQITTTAGAAASDTVQIDTLKSQLATATNRATALQRRINELSNANPAALTCRLPDGLRESINADLAPVAR